LIFVSLSIFGKVSLHILNFIFWWLILKGFNMIVSKIHGCKTKLFRVDIWAFGKDKYKVRIIKKFVGLWMDNSTKHRSAKFQTLSSAVDLLWSCEGLWRGLLCFLGQIVTWQYNPNLLDGNWPCTVINDHDWQLWKCLLSCWQF